MSPSHSDRALEDRIAAHDAELERRARAGKREFIVEVVDTKRYRAWADDAQKAEDAVYWQRSSGRPMPDVEEFGASTRTFNVR